jgi:hypothetical protein
MPSSRAGCSSYKGKISMRWPQIYSFIMMVHRTTFVLQSVQYWISYLCRHFQILRILCIWLQILIY